MMMRAFVISMVLLHALPASTLSAEQTLPLIGGTGGVYLLAEPGELVIDLEKRDLNRSGRPADLRAILVGPDRKVIHDITIADDGKSRGSGPGPRQQARLTAEVQRKGVYGLNITVSNDRYGTEIGWGFRTNAQKYLIETARGHRDARREEPIVLVESDGPRDVCFLPSAGDFDIQIAGLEKDSPAVSLYDDRNQLIDTLPVQSDGKASTKIAANSSRGSVPWRLHLPTGKAAVHIDGVTRWDAADRYPNLPLWTPDRKSWFTLHDFRWLITPYQRTKYAAAASEQTIEFQIHNNSSEQQTIRLELEFPGDPWRVSLEPDAVALNAKQSRKVTLRYTAPGERQTVHVRATPVKAPEFSTYATLNLIPGQSPVGQPLSLPLTLTAYRHENEQFGYLPDYPIDNQVYFDQRNRPYVNTGVGVKTWREHQWEDTPLKNIASADADLAGRDFAAVSSKIAFDAQGAVYVVGTSGRKAALLRSTDAARTFTAFQIPGRESASRSFDIEQFSGHNGSDGPPPMIRVTRTASDPNRIWRRINDLELFVPEYVSDYDGDSIRIGEPILITNRCIGISGHSGMPSSIVSRGSKIHIAWAEATDPEEKVPGVPTFVVTYDRETRVLGEPTLVGYGAPPNDIHNTPSITMDRGGYLHVLVGTHGRPFQYVKSLVANDASGGWTEPVTTGGNWDQTYIGLVCDSQDTLHLVSRIWRRGEPPYPASHHARLSHQKKNAEGVWQAPQWLVVPPLSEYSVFYHRLTVDRMGRLFLSYDCWSTYWFYRTDYPPSRRALMMSLDGGDHWQLVTNDDLISFPNKASSDD